MLDNGGAVNKFQFQYGAIGRLFPPSYLYCYVSFQFQYGAIGRPVFPTLQILHLNFNSSMVRLVDNIDSDQSGNPLFQFQYGAIGSVQYLIQIEMFR